jgi:predicted nucleic acid-binding protein
MPGAKAFFDTIVLLYLLSEDEAKADRTEALIAGGGVISVQVLNEFTAVASRKLGMSWREIQDTLDPIRKICRIEHLRVESYDAAVHVARRYGFSFFDATIVASALGADCDILYSEDLQDGQSIEKRLTIRNPFKT